LSANICQKVGHRKNPNFFLQTYRKNIFAIFLVGQGFCYLDFHEYSIWGHFSISKSATTERRGEAQIRLIVSAIFPPPSSLLLLLPVYFLTIKITQEGSMTKADLIDKMAGEADISKAAAGKALDSFVDGIIKTVKKGNKVALVGFGTFSVSKRKARTGRNPQTGATIKIAERKVPKFSAGKAFKDAVK
jgi:DNA-binding protein HU-beta